MVDAAKTAGPATAIIRDEFLKGTGKGLALLGGLGLIGAARETMRVRANTTHEREREGHFLNVLKKNPELAAADPVKVRELFEDMDAANPSFAKSPRIAASWIHSQLHYGGKYPPFSSYADLVNVQKAHEGTARSKLQMPVSTQFSVGMLSGSK